MSKAVLFQGSGVACVDAKLMAGIPVTGFVKSSSIYPELLEVVRHGF